MNDTTQHVPGVAYCPAQVLSQYLMFRAQFSRGRGQGQRPGVSLTCVPCPLCPLPWQSDCHNTLCVLKHPRLCHTALCYFRYFPWWPDQQDVQRHPRRPPPEDRLRRLQGREQGRVQIRPQRGRQTPGESLLSSVNWTLSSLCDLIAGPALPRLLPPYSPRAAGRAHHDAGGGVRGARAWRAQELLRALQDVLLPEPGVHPDRRHHRDHHLHRPGRAPGRLRRGARGNVTNIELRAPALEINVIEKRIFWIFL